jgi:hypothetical protein
MRRDIIEPLGHCLSRKTHIKQCLNKNETCCVAKIFENYKPQGITIKVVQVNDEKKCKKLSKHNRGYFAQS